MGQVCQGTPTDTGFKASGSQLFLASRNLKIISHGPAHGGSELSTRKDLVLDREAVMRVQLQGDQLELHQHWWNPAGVHLLLAILHSPNLCKIWLRDHTADNFPKLAPMISKHQPSHRAALLDHQHERQHDARTTALPASCPQAISTRLVVKGGHRKADVLSVQKYHCPLRCISVVNVLASAHCSANLSPSQSPSC